LIGAKVPVNEEGDTVEGYHVLVGGGFGQEGRMARELIRDVKAGDAPATVERVLAAYIAHRASKAESFHAFTGRHDTQALLALMEPVR
jgi:ferredoxin-nitrite reductase